MYMHTCIWQGAHPHAADGCGHQRGLLNTGLTFNPTCGYGLGLPSTRHADIHIFMLDVATNEGY